MASGWCRIVRLHPGVTVDSMVPAVGPSATALGQVLVDLGRHWTYVLFCNFQDAPDKPRRLAMGTFTSIQVK
jgi:hypothetical protein